MRIIRPLAKLLVFFVLLYCTLFVLSSIAAYSGMRETVPNAAVEESSGQWVSGGTFAAGRGKATSLFGTIPVSFPLHCYETAQAYYDAGVYATANIIFILLFPVSLVLFAYLKIRTRIRFSLKNVVFLSVTVALISFGAVQLWINAGKTAADMKLTVIHPPCY